jgi:chemotaxis-related protein WspD
MSETESPQTPSQTPSQNLFDRPLPPGYRDELQALIAARPAHSTRRTGSILLFQLGELRLALPTRVASAVAPVLHIARIPHRSGTVLLGLAAFRGEIMPCCSLTRILDLPQNPGDGAAHFEATAARTLILEESGGRRWAVPIDGVLGVRTRHGVPGIATGPLAAQWLQGSYEDQDGAIHLLDPDVLFRQITLATA